MSNSPLIGRIVTQYVYARRRRIVTAVISLAHASLLVWALARFYRRFIYNDAAGRVWGVADDVYISASFARSLFDGHGLVWYPGAPHVEGITNPLWTLFIAGLHGVVGFSEDRLGLFVACLNGALLFVVAMLFGSTVVAAARNVALCDDVTIDRWVCLQILVEPLIFRQATDCEAHVFRFGQRTTDALRLCQSVSKGGTNGAFRPT